MNCSDCVDRWKQWCQQILFVVRAAQLPDSWKKSRRYKLVDIKKIQKVMSCDTATQTYKTYFLKKMAHKRNKPLQKQATAFYSTTYTEKPFALGSFVSANLETLSCTSPSGVSMCTKKINYSWAIISPLLPLRLQWYHAWSTGHWEIIEIIIFSEGGRK